MRNTFAWACGLLVALPFVTGLGAQAADIAKPDPAPAAFARSSDKTMHVFFRDKDGKIMEMFTKRGEDKGWSSLDLTAAANAPKAAGTPAAFLEDNGKIQHVFYRGTDNNIHELFLAGPGDKWRHANLTASDKAPKAAGDLSAYVSRGNKSLHVVFRTDSGAVCELFRDAGEGKTWTIADLTAATGAAKAAGNPQGFTDYDGKSQHVVYRGTDNNIHELFLLGKQGEKWGHANLTDSNKAPKAAGDPCGFAADGDKSMHVVYRSEAGAIIELFREEGVGKNWTLTDLSGATGAGKAVGDPCAFSDSNSKSMHVVYHGTDDQIHELFLAKKGDKWSHANLTEKAKAPKAAGCPTGFASKDDKSVHVIYPMAGGGMAELYRESGEGKAWAHNKLSATAKPGGGE